MFSRSQLVPCGGSGAVIAVRPPEVDAASVAEMYPSGRWYGHRFTSCAAEMTETSCAPTAVAFGASVCTMPFWFTAPVADSDSAAQPVTVIRPDGGGGIVGCELPLLPTAGSQPRLTAMAWPGPVTSGAIRS